MGLFLLYTMTLQCKQTKKISKLYIRGFKIRYQDFKIRSRIPRYCEKSQVVVTLDVCYSATVVSGVRMPIECDDMKTLFPDTCFIHKHIQLHTATFLNV